MRGVKVSPLQLNADFGVLPGNILLSVLDLEPTTLELETLHSFGELGYSFPRAFGHDPSLYMPTEKWTSGILQVGT